MPRRDDLKSILIIGAGPIVIGQGCEFDYSGTQAARALKEEGYKIILVNSNPATIMTDPEIAYQTYIEPITVEYVTEIIKIEKPDAILPTVGGQTALNLAIELNNKGILKKFNVKLFKIPLAEDGYFNLKEVLYVCKHLKPQKTILTNLHHDLDYNYLLKKVPKDVMPAYDGLKLNL